MMRPGNRGGNAAGGAMSLGDGGIDRLTGQGHGGSFFRFHARDYLEDRALGTGPVVRVIAIETAPGR